MCFPAKATPKEIMASNPTDLSFQRTGRPGRVTYVIETVQEFLGKIPIFGICLGNQILGLALGGKTYKLKFGHHGANHPVKDFEGNRIAVTSQNHGFLRGCQKPYPTSEVIHVN